MNIETAKKTVDDYLSGCNPQYIDLTKFEECVSKVKSLQSSDVEEILTYLLLEAKKCQPLDRLSLAAKVVWALPEETREYDEDKEEEFIRQFDTLFSQYLGNKPGNNTHINNTHIYFAEWVALYLTAFPYLESYENKGLIFTRQSPWHVGKIISLLNTNGKIHYGTTQSLGDKAHVLERSFEELSGKHREMVTRMRESDEHKNLMSFLRGDDMGDFVPALG